MSDRYEQLTIGSRAEWRAWLAEHHAASPGIWVVTAKKSAGDGYVPVDAIVEEALCFGWIDSLPRSLDDRRSMRLLTPRKAGSNWSKVNKERIARLDAAGLIDPAGQAVIDAARADGSWSALDEVEQLIEPDDLRAALDANPDARRYWDAFPRSVKRAILEWLGNAKKPETRARRVTETAELAAQNIRANQWRQPKGGRPRG